MNSMGSLVEFARSCGASKTMPTMGMSLAARRCAASRNKRIQFFPCDGDGKSGCSTQQITKSICGMVSALRTHDQRVFNLCVRSRKRIRRDQRCFGCAFVPKYCEQQISGRSRNKKPTKGRKRPHRARSETKGKVLSHPFSHTNDSQVGERAAAGTAKGAEKLLRRVRIYLFLRHHQHTAIYEQTQ